MSKWLTGLAASAALGLCVMGPTTLSAATISFDGAGNQGGGSYTEDSTLTFDDVRIVSGQCGVANPCGALNKNETSVLTNVISGMSFTLTSLFVSLQGSNAALELMSELGSVRITTEGTFDLASTGFFTNVQSVTFTADPGNVRFDDINYDVVAAVPVPAAGFLLLGALGALGLSRKRRSA